MSANVPSREGDFSPPLPTKLQLTFSSNRLQEVRIVCKEKSRSDSRDLDLWWPHQGRCGGCRASFIRSSPQIRSRDSEDPCLVTSKVGRFGSGK